MSKTTSADNLRILGFPTVEHEAPRPEDDFYPTCQEATISLLVMESFDGPVWEPACGDGAISESLKKKGIKVYSSDLYDHGYGKIGVDFLKAEEWILPPFKDIVTNPPFKLALEFAKQGSTLAYVVGGKFCMLARLMWLEGIKRKKELYDLNAPSRVHVSSRRLPTMSRKGVETSTTGSTVAFAWYVWDSQSPKRTEINWFDWKDYV